MNIITLPVHEIMGICHDGSRFVLGCMIVDEYYQFPAIYTYPPLKRLWRGMPLTVHHQGPWFFFINSDNKLYGRLFCGNPTLDGPAVLIEEKGCRKVKSIPRDVECINGFNSSHIRSHSSISTNYIAFAMQGWPHEANDVAKNLGLLVSTETEKAFRKLWSKHLIIYHRSSHTIKGIRLDIRPLNPVIDPQEMVCAVADRRDPNLYLIDLDQ